MFTYQEDMLTVSQCGTWDIPQGLHGGCDGSLFTGVSPDVELDRDDNKGLQDIAVIIKNLAAKYQTSVADMIVFAGSKKPLLNGLHSSRLTY